MVKKVEEELSKHTLNLFSGDYNRLQELYPDIGAGPIIRRLVRDYLSKVEAARPPLTVKEQVQI
jgi:hypothetical protein